jgi:hypothetical protein
VSGKAQWFKSSLLNVFNNTVHKATHHKYRPYKCKDLGGSKFALFFNFKNELDGFIENAPSQILHPTNPKARASLSYSWPGSLPLSIHSSPKFTLFCHLPLKALVDAYQLNHASEGKPFKPETVLPDETVRKLLTELVGDPSGGRILGANSVSSSGGIVAYFKTKEDRDAALETGLSLPGILQNFEFYPTHVREIDDPMLCHY